MPPSKSSSKPRREVIRATPKQQYGLVSAFEKYGTFDSARRKQLGNDLDLPASWIAEWIKRHRKKLKLPGNDAKSESDSDDSDLPPPPPKKRKFVPDPPESMPIPRSAAELPIPTKPTEPPSSFGNSPARLRRLTPLHIACAEQQVLPRDEFPHTSPELCVSQPP